MSSFHLSLTVPHYHLQTHMDERRAKPHHQWSGRETKSSENDKRNNTEHNLDVETHIIHSGQLIDMKRQGMIV